MGFSEAFFGALLKGLFSDFFSNMLRKRFLNKSGLFAALMDFWGSTLSTSSVDDFDGIF